ncbi:MAG: hypothetical protein OEY00_11105 [Gammaproteobacteria bacterium]|nr:hypothetical protein [Gammaproteobacteria bacterium]
MGDVTEAVQRHRNLVQSSSGTIASITLTKTGQKVAGVLVTPAIWVYNYSTKGSTPDKIDYGIYGMGFFGALSSAAAIPVGIVKALVDDDTGNKLRLIRNSEEQKYRPFILPCSQYSMNAPQINAQTIASKGGTAWRHPNGLWVYIVDANGHLVHDFKPKRAAIIYQPNLPLKKTSRGTFYWGSHR